jgi:hypothetical protein
VLNTRAHYNSTYEWKPDFVCVTVVFGFYQPNKTTIFLVDWCGRLASHHCPHYLCWSSSTCDYRSYRVFTFLIDGFCSVKPQWDGDIFKISSLKDFSLRSIILLAFWWLKSVDIQCLQILYKVSWGAFGHLITLGILGASPWPTPQILKGSTFGHLSYTKQGSLERDCFINPTLQPTCFQEENFGSFQNVSDNRTHWPIPRNSHGKMYKKPGNNIIIPNMSQNCTRTHLKQIQWENVQKILVKTRNNLIM